MNAHDRAKVLREAGAVERCHTIPHHGSYSVGLHSFNAVNLLLCLHPNPSMDLVKALLWHDAPERWIGDTPATALWSSDAFNESYLALEHMCLDRAGLLIQLTDEDERWLRAIDKLELLLWTFDQLALGNQLSQKIRAALVGWFEREATKIPDPVTVFLETYYPGRSTDLIPKETDDAPHS
jgi:5'-deoxynucleotidase YfbR-like HD superfamily hydrolase